MPVQSYAKTGRVIALNLWGQDSALTQDDYIKQLTQESRTTCLLAAVIHEIYLLRQDIVNLRQPAPPRSPSPPVIKKTHPVSDGMLAALNIANPQLPALDVLLCHLGVRARKAIHRMRIETVEEIVAKTADDFLELKGVGFSSIHQLREGLNRFGLALSGETPSDDWADPPFAEKKP